jgi:hypothetical protein
VRFFTFPNDAAMSDGQAPDPGYVYLRLGSRYNFREVKFDAVVICTLLHASDTVTLNSQPREPFLLEKIGGWCLVGRI